MLCMTKRVVVTDNDGNTSESDVPLLFSLVCEIRPILKEFLFELNHLSDCVLSNSECNFSWCKDLKKDLFHASICTDSTCKRCTVLRPLILIHSIQCPKNNCTLPFCDVGVSVSSDVALSERMEHVYYEYERMSCSRYHQSVFISDQSGRYSLESTFPLLLTPRTLFYRNQSMPRSIRRSSVPLSFLLGLMCMTASRPTWSQVSSIRLSPRPIPRWNSIDHRSNALLL